VRGFPGFVVVNVEKNT